MTEPTISASTTGSRSRRARWLYDSYLLLPLVGALVVFSVWYVTLKLIHTEQQAYRQSLIQSTAESAETVSAQMKVSLGTIRETLRILKYSHQLQGRKISLAEMANYDMLPKSSMLYLFVANRSGQVSATNAPEIFSENVSQSPSFLTLRDRPPAKPNT